VNQKPALELGAILHAAYAAEGAIEARLSEAGLSLAKLMALKALAEAGESLPLSQLAARLSCVKSNITQLVDRLEGDGLVSRQADPNDRRARLASLTASGRKAVAEGTRLQKEAERNVLKRLSAAEARQLAALIEKIGRDGG
jgi:DNA-binding MarR family transcriptional regulator